MNHPVYTIRVQLPSVTLEDLQKVCKVFEADVKQIDDKFEIATDDPEILFWIGLNLPKK